MSVTVVVGEMWRTYVVPGIFPDPSCCLRLVRSQAVEMHENWIETTLHLIEEFRQ